MNPAAIELNRILGLCGGQPKDMELMELYREVEEEMSDEDVVKAKYPDAEVSSAFAKQPDGGKLWMYCVMSFLKFLASRGKKRVANVGTWRFTKADAWADARRRLEEK